MRFLKDNNGIGTIELVLILLVIIGLIVVFRTQIMQIIDTVFSKVNNSISTI